MKTTQAAIGSAIFFLLAPGVFAGLAPWLITRWRLPEIDAWWIAFQVLGGVLIAAAVVVLVHSFARFVTEGQGTPAPVAAPTNLVIGGYYRYVRNPMYVAVVSAVLGQALLFGSLWLLAYAAAAWAITTAFVMLYEEPELKRRFGAEYAKYRQGVGRWIPRLTPWRP